MTGNNATRPKHAKGGTRTRLNPLTRLAKRIGAWYEAHAARLHALRVYDRRRS